MLTQISDSSAEDPFGPDSTKSTGVDNSHPLAGIKYGTQRFRKGTAGSPEAPSTEGILEADRREFSGSPLYLLLREAPGMSVILPILAIAWGLLTLALITAGHLLTKSFSEIPVLLATVFSLLGLGRLLSGTFAETMVARLSSVTLAGFRDRLARLLLRVPVRRLESAGSNRILGRLTDHISAVSETIAIIPALVMNLAIVAAGGVYLLMISPLSFLALAPGATLGILIYFPLVQACQRSWNATIKEDDEFSGHLIKIREGIEELKLNQDSRELYFSDCLRNTNLAHCKNRVEATRRNTLLLGAGYLLAFLLLGLVLFVLPRYGLLDASGLAGYVVTCALLVGPVTSLLHAFPLLVHFRKAFDALRRFEKDLATESPGETAQRSSPTNWRTISLLSVEVQAPEGERSILGPVDLLIERSELIYITGGNGSGKSTLGKTLCGLYSPDAGELLHDGKSVTDATRDSYRQHFTTVLSEGQRFDEYLGIPSPALQLRAQTYLESLRLDHVVTIEDGRFRTKTPLSQRQKKRLALLAAYLEDRDIYLFDEWAADEAPEFREMFYRNFLKDLHARGKTVIVITADEQYLAGAPRIIEMKQGLIASDQQQVATEPRSELIGLN